MQVSFRGFRSLRAVVVVALLISALSVGPALAGKPAPQPTTSGKCWVAPNPVVNGIQYTVYGSGFAPGTPLAILVSDGVSGSYLMTTTDASGNFSVWSWAQFIVPGTKNVTVYRSGDRKMTVLSSSSFSVL